MESFDCVKMLRINYRKSHYKTNALNAKEFQGYNIPIVANCFKFD